jgi:hypothetical protein
MQNAQLHADLQVHDSKQDSNRPVATARLQNAFDHPILRTKS